MAQTVTYELFERYVRSEASTEEITLVQAWLAHPANQLVAQHWMHHHWEALNAAPLQQADEPDYEAMLASLHQQLEIEVTPHTVRIIPMWRRWAAAAAVVGGLIGSGWLAQKQLASSPAAVVAPIEYATAYGATRTVHLPDGSTMMLNANSTLRYAAPTDGQAREAWLDGEGYFEVKHQADDRRFVVHTKAGLDVEVLGTRFNVYRRHERAQVVLISGKVRVSFTDRQHADVIMKPGEMVEARTQPAAALVQKTTVTEPAAYSAWKDGKLVLNETSIDELTTRLRDIYGVEVVVNSPELKARKVTGTVSVRDLDVLLLALQESFHLKVERQAGRIILSDTRSPKPAL